MTLYRALQPKDPVLTDGSDQRLLAEITQSQHFFLFGLFETEYLLASTYVNIIPNLTRSASPYAVIENVITKPSLQNTGLGRELMACTLSFIWERGCYKAMLMTGSKKESTHAFYRACGFNGTAKTGYITYPG
ncbi:MAG: GNAT family N-acetyltransferase [Pseudomonadales bacterium]|nr:GNAT family N-acetyltransferase [Pseudomonadales bacterium]